MSILAVCFAGMGAIPCLGDDWASFSKELGDGTAALRTARTDREKVAIARKLLGHEFWNGYETVNRTIIRPSPGSGEYRLKHVLSTLLTVPDPAVRTAALERLANYRRFRAEFETRNESLFFSRPEYLDTEMRAQGDINPRLLDQMLTLAADEKEPALQKQALGLLRSDLRLRGDGDTLNGSELSDQGDTDRLVERVTGGETREERQAAVTLMSDLLRARTTRGLTSQRIGQLVTSALTLLRSDKPGERMLGLDAASYLFLNWTRPLSPTSEGSKHPELMKELLSLARHSDGPTRKRALDILGGTVVKFSLTEKNIRASLSGNDYETIPLGARILDERQRALKRQAVELIRMSHSTHPETRQGGLLLLAAIRSEAHPSPVLDRRIFDALRDPDPAVRGLAAQLLLTGEAKWPGTDAEVRLGDGAQAKLLAGGLSDLVRLVRTETDPTLLAHLKTWRRSLAVRDLLWGQVARDIELEARVSEQLDRPNEQKLRIVAALWERGKTDAAARERLRELARQEPNEAARWFLLQRFAESATTDPAAKSLLLHALDHDYSREIRTRTAELLRAKFPGDTAVRNVLTRAYVQGRILDDDNCRELLLSIGYLNPI